MSMYWEQNVGGFQEEDFDIEVEDEDYVTQKPQMQGTEKEEQMENPEVKAILTLKLQRRNESLNDKYKNKESRIQKFEVGVSWV